MRWPTVCGSRFGRLSFRSFSGIPAGVGLARRSSKGNVLFEVLLLLPLIVPEIILAVAFAGLYGFVRLRFSFWTIVTTHVAFSLSYVILMVRSRMARLDPSLVEAAMDLGAGPSHTFFRVLLPHLTPAVLASSLMVFTISLDDYVITSFVAGAGNTTLPLQIYSMAKEGLTPEINAVCTLLMVVTVMMALAAQWAQRAAVSWRKMMPIPVADRHCGDRTACLAPLDNGRLTARFSICTSGPDISLQTH